MAKAKITEPRFDPALYDMRHVFDIGLEALQLTNTHGAATSWYASSLGYCLRRQFLERAGVPREREASRTLWLGDAIHNATQRLYRQSGLLIAEELLLADTDLALRGRVDMIWGGEIESGLLEGEEEFSPQWQDYLLTFRKNLRLAYGDTFPVTGCEMKSANQWSAERSFAEGPQFHHIMQVASYQLMYERGGAPDGFDYTIDRWQLAMLAKSDMKMPIFDVAPHHVEQVGERLENLNAFWSVGTLPPCTCGKELSWEIGYCAFGEGPKPHTKCCNADLIRFATNPPPGGTDG